MPILEIIQKLYYKHSHLEQTLEKSLQRYNMELPQPGIYSAQDLIYGITRTIQGKTTDGDIVDLTLWKFFEDERLFIKTTTETVPHQYIDEQKLVQILNLNKIHSEDLILDTIHLYNNEKMRVKIALEDYPSNHLTKLYYEGVMFAEILLNYHKFTSTKSGALYHKHLTQELTKMKSPVSIEELNKILKNILNIDLKKKDYIDMLVDYYQSIIHLK